ncbi:hypothetical protein Kpol_1002p50 [Vanderwaltozyma polyspora DSM 70294]|uniref:SCA7 domain-containing protein n=1 Tax=Vanderwaltozyma polyspora (strain ATCC 22028 / DSM 70294 / BCRC 21397 / CBS 2163 / NBRC 10782 / NRRL Y-8283 / UCD 57-17) TaxID=436907 RepID=A7TE81_VANPO|nr:uncharacterized protein Kpol_1002p50 [Vanderwaltozyma polyspora DSM 70294]EDO19403.1 hypothetical protein Kpol_1002p50 [Vanderwaltozyma polyspora DSM 70294]
MADIYTEIKGIKQTIKDKFSNITETIENSGTTNGKNKGWKQLLSSAKGSPFQYSHINLDHKNKYFNANTHLLENTVESNSSSNYRICNSCGRPISLETIVDHLNNHCNSNSTEKDRMNSSDNIDIGDTSNVEDNSIILENTDDNKRSMSELAMSTPEQPSTPSKRQKTSQGQNGTRKQRKVKQRNPTEKHLIDFDKQCGVELPEGGYCARSLTCKSHSMGAKRSVLGRNQPFDVLLADYHREHQTKIGAAAEKRAKQQEIQKQQKQTQKEQKKQAQAKARSKNSGSSRKFAAKQDLVADDPNTNVIMLTPEEETTQVLNGVSRSYPLPLDSTILYSVRRRTKYFRMREMFASSFTVKAGYSSPGYGSIHSRVGCIDIDKSTEYKFRVRTPQATNQLQQQQSSQNSQNQAQQLQKAQQQRLLQAQIMQQQKQQQQQLQMQRQNQGQNQNINQGQNQISNNAVPTSNIPQSIKQTPENSKDSDLTPQEIQFQQQKLRQQQIQQNKYEAAAYHMANNTKLSPGSPSSMGQVGSPVGGGRVNVGIGSSVNGTGARVN